MKTTEEQLCWLVSHRGLGPVVSYIQFWWAVMVLVREAPDLLSSLSWQVHVHLYQLFSFLSTIAKTCGRNNRQFQKGQAVGTDCFWVCSEAVYHGTCGMW